MLSDDYIIDHSNVDWPGMLSPWHRLLPQDFTVWLMNRYGDLFVVMDDSSVWMFDVGCGTFERLAISRDDFCNQLEIDENRNNWLMVPLIDRLVAAGMLLGSGQCYGYTISPVLGGDYSVENTFVIPIEEHYSFNADLHEQIRDLPDGTPIKFKVVD